MSTSIAKIVKTTTKAPNEDASSNSFAPAARKREECAAFLELGLVSPTQVGML